MMARRFLRAHKGEGGSDVKGGGHRAQHVCRPGGVVKNVTPWAQTGLVIVMRLRDELSLRDSHIFNTCHGQSRFTHRSVVM
jgi:hypothetical protein